MDLEQLLGRMQAQEPTSLEQMATVPVGAASRAAAIQRARRLYNDYLIETQSTGETPLPFEDWYSTQMGAPATANPYRPR